MKTYSETDITRFYTHVAVTGPDECWEWLGCTGADDTYGRFRFGGTMWLAHRFAFWFAGGVHPEDLCVCHSCDNPSCQNPAHLWLGTQKENVQDCIRKHRNAFGARHGLAKLTDQDVLDIRAQFATGLISNVALAKEFGLTDNTIGCIVKRKTWVHI